MPGLPKLKDFLQGMKDDPKSTVLYIAFIAIVALFGILRASDKRTSERQDRELVECRASASASALTAKVENNQMRGQLIDVMGALKEMKGEMNTLRKLGIIK